MMMFSAIRKRLRVSPATVIALLALVFAMSGGAFAAGRYLITSTKQISPKVLKSLAGKAGTGGAPGAQGPAGAVGAAGPGGSQGPAGTPGTPGKEGPPGKNGENGKNGTTGFTKTLPTGDTEKGTWSLSVPAHNPTAGFSASFASISFVIPLESAPTAHYLKSTEKETPECPGTAEEPRAGPGQLCVYAQSELSVPTLNVASKSYGAYVVELFPGGAEPGGVAVGSWAVTAE
jgi:hypothetical protein